MPTACRQPTRLAALDSEQGFKGYLAVGLCASAAVHFLLSRGRAECPVLCLASASVLGNVSHDLRLANARRFLCTRDNTSIGYAENNRLPDRQDLRSIFRTSHKIFCYLASTHPLPCSFPLQHESIDSVIVSVTPSPPEYVIKYVVSVQPDARAVGAATVVRPLQTERLRSLTGRTQLCAREEIVKLMKLIQKFSGTFDMRVDPVKVCSLPISIMRSWWIALPTQGNPNDESSYDQYENGLQGHSLLSAGARSSG